VLLTFPTQPAVRLVDVLSAVVGTGGLPENNICVTKIEEQKLNNEDLRKSLEFCYDTCAETHEVERIPFKLQEIEQINRRLNFVETQENFNCFPSGISVSR
jgi:hypothetical protein